MQKAVDGAIEKAQAKAKGADAALLKTYLRSRFSLGKNDKLHAMKF